MRKKIIFIGVFIIAMILGLALFLFYVQHMVLLDGPLEKNTHIVIKKGASVKSIANILNDNGVIDKPFVFTIWTRFLGMNSLLKAGEYEFPKAISQGHVIAMLVNHNVVDHFITIAEGLSSRQIITLINSEKLLDGVVNIIPKEGSLLPETYHFSKNDKRANIILAMQNAQDNILQKLWDKRAKNLPFKSKFQALILASIVEKETGINAERAKIAGVFINRLNIGMRLQSDPTVAFAVMDGKGKLTRPLRRADLKLKHPYNTYFIKGLPPTPIANPGIAAIKAVLNPDDTKALYFVADGSGGHAFANSLAQHNRNVAKWRKINN